MTPSAPRIRTPWVQRITVVLAWGVLLGMAGYVLAPTLADRTTVGGHDWDQMESHRYLVTKTILRFHLFPFWNPYSCGGHSSWGGFESGTVVVSPWLPFYLALSAGARPARRDLRQRPDLDDRRLAPRGALHPERRGPHSRGRRLRGQRPVDAAARGRAHVAPRLRPHPVGPLLLRSRLRSLGAAARAALARHRVPGRRPGDDGLRGGHLSLAADRASRGALRRRPLDRDAQRPAHRGRPRRRRHRPRARGAEAAPHPRGALALPAPGRLDRVHGLHRLRADPRRPRPGHGHAGEPREPVGLARVGHVRRVGAGRPRDGRHHPRPRRP